MAFQFPLNGWSVACIIASIFIIVTKLSRSSSHLGVFPTVGSNSWLSSWWAGFKFLTNARDFIQTGYEKYNPAPFKLAELSCWTVYLTGRTHLEELARASDTEFSLDEAMQDQFQVKYMVGASIFRNPYHTAIIRSHLTRNIDILCSEIRDEIMTSFDDVLDLGQNEWKSVTASTAIEQIVCRTSNRVFVGLPLCHHPDWIDLNIKYTLDVIKGGIIIGLFPELLRPLAVQFLTNIPRSIMRGVKLLGPIIEERKGCLDEYGMNWDGKPNDFLSWLIDEGRGPELTVRNLTNRMLSVTFAAIHTTSNCFTQALFYLAANPQYTQTLRDEVEEVVEKDGWTKVGLGNMRKVDSFLRECLRIEGLRHATISRKALTDFTFSDGTFIPKGTLIAAATCSLHHDERLYANPDSFEPFRFVTPDGRGGDQKHQFASATTEYLPFGLGRHVCPGRFFAAVELKFMLAHIVLTYDVRLENDATRPPSSQTIQTFVSANRDAKVLFRNRVR